VSKFIIAAGSSESQTGGKTALDKLPEDERATWRQLWDDVEGLLKKVADKGPTSP
jgi:hypothetical protein